MSYELYSTEPHGSRILDGGVVAEISRTTYHGDTNTRVLYFVEFRDADGDWLSSYGMDTLSGIDAEISAYPA